MANTFTFRHLRRSQICLNYRENGERVNVMGFGASGKRVWLKNPGNTFKVKRHAEGRWREAITGNQNNYSTCSKEKKEQGKRGGVKEKKRQNSGATVPLKGCAEEACALTWVRHLQTFTWKEFSGKSWSRGFVGNERWEVRGAGD